MRTFHATASDPAVVLADESGLVQPGLASATEGAAQSDKPSNSRPGRKTGFYEGKTMRTRTRTILAGLVLAAALVGGVAWATIPDDNGLYTACKLNASGTIRLIDPSGPTTSLLSRCTSYETKITWNQKGPKGEPGAAGANGTNGAAGSNGTDGAPGAKGDPCLATDPACIGPKGDTGAAGMDGTNGPNGINGTDGAKGDPCLATDPACVGPKGDTGAAGIAGPQGAKGETGLTGAAGPAGTATTYTARTVDAIGAATTATAFCLAGERVTGGGGSGLDDSTIPRSGQLIESRQVGANGWRVTYSSGSHAVWAQVICVS